MRLLIVVPRQDRATGNWVTASRLESGLKKRGHLVTSVEAGSDGTLSSDTAVATQPEAALLLHAWRSGRPWLEAGMRTPFAVLLTGTDVHIGMRDQVQAPVIAEVLTRASAILSQNQLTVAELRAGHPELAGKLRYLPPGITFGTARFPLRNTLAASAREFVLLCPAGIRPVKGVLELLDLVEPLVHAGYPLRLACCGPVLDAAYGERLLTAIAARPWASYLGSIPPEAMPDAMRQADAIVSNSFSEGLPNALVEAATLGRPIVARDIPGNRAVVVDGGNGLLYADAKGFSIAIRRLCDEPALRAALSRPDPECFSADREAAVLETIFMEILNGRAATASLGQILIDDRI